MENNHTLNYIVRLCERMIVLIYVKLFARKFFYRFNRALLTLSMHGIGILNYETKERSGEFNFIEKIISNYKKEALVVFDIGANQGDYSDMFLRKKKNILVYAFEPNPKAFHKLSEFGINKKNLNLINKGCSDSNSKMIMYDLKSDDGSELASLYRDVIVDIHKSEYSETKVEVIKLDDFCEQNKIEKINLLKVDTEGNELKVLMGARSMIERGNIDVIHFEFNEMNVASRSYFKDFHDLLKEYSLYRLLPDGAIALGEYNPLTWEIFAFQNIVAVRHDISDMIKL